MKKGKQLLVVWDLPTRLFHWCLVLLVGVLLASALFGRFDLHEVAGEGVLALLVFRLAWGFIGSQTARFGDFLGGLATIKDYIAHRKSKSLGHNPLGGLMVMAFLAVLLAQVSTGLFSNDGILFLGPLANLVDQNMSDALSGIHALLANILWLLVVAHISAIALYWIVGKENLLVPMLTGKKWVFIGIKPMRLVSVALAIGIQGLALFAIGVLLVRF
jgi:cytochrome b